MAKGAYIGVDGVAHKVKKGYIGIDGIARKIKKAYIGIGGVAKLCWASADPVFANNTWAEIIAACQSNSVPDEWKVGDSKTMTINGTDYLIDIIGKNHDDYADGSGTAPLTFQMHDCYNTTRRMNSSDQNRNGWAGCEMRTDWLPSNILTKMPTEVQAGIKEVNKTSSDGGAFDTLTTSADKLFLLAEIEVLNTTTYSVAGEGVQYEYYSAGNSAIKKVSGAASTWWLRSPRKANTLAYCCVTSAGGLDGLRAGYTYGVAPAFCF